MSEHHCLHKADPGSQPPASHSRGLRPGREVRASSMAQPRIEQRIHHVDGEVDQHEEQREDQHDALDQRQVAIDDGVDRHVAEALVGKQPLDDDRAADEEGELHPDRMMDVVACGQFTTCAKLLEYAFTIERF